LPKPIERGKLDELMKNWVAVETSETKRGDETGRPAMPGFVVEGLDTSLCLWRIGGSRKNYLDALRIFCRDTAVKLPALEKTAHDSPRDFTITVHALKGALANIGAIALSEEAALLETEGNKGSVLASGRLNGFMSKVGELAGRIESALAEGVSSEDEYAAVAMPSAESLSALRKALLERNIGVIDAMIEEMSEPRFGKHMTDSLSAISDHVLISNFEEAADIADTLRKEAEI
jgi:HPt (histidine-containing phosphotransfer) domain-containing protein